MSLRKDNLAEYNSWFGMKTRCYNPKSKNYKNWGGRGIKVCDRWLNSFENFLKDMGKKPDKTFTLDRIDNDKNYTPKNCKWATWKEQANNRRGNIDDELRGSDLNSNKRFAIRHELHRNNYNKKRKEIISEYQLSYY